MNATIVLGDLHLTRHSRPDVVEDLARLLEAHRGHRVVVAGDFFDLATDAPGAVRREAIAGVMGKHPRIRQALGEHVERDGELLLLGGNHDADLGRDDLAPALHDELGLPGALRGRVTARPWFLREEDGLHLEHGHFYDPDNAPAHPLVVGEPSLGVHFSGAFVHPTGAHRYLQANDGTPLKLFLASFSWYGRRAPFVILKYFEAALGALARSGPFFRAHGERSEGEERLAQFAEDAGVPRDVVDAVLAVGVPSTLESFSNTFFRLYLDRVIASTLLGTGAALATSGRRIAGAGTAALGGMLMTLSWLHGHNRYLGNVVDHLDHAARRIVDETDAKLVVFGHTHREALEDHYANTGSFAFPRDAPGRPYLRIERGDRLRAVRRYL